MKLRFEICEMNLTNKIKLRQNVLLQGKLSMNGISKKNGSQTSNSGLTTLERVLLSTNIFFRNSGANRL